MWPTLLLASGDGQQTGTVKVDHLFYHHNIISNTIMKLTEPYKGSTPQVLFYWML
jgi:hypothetical protein